MRWLFLLGIFVIGIGLSTVLVKHVGKPQVGADDSAAAAPTAVPGAAAHQTPTTLATLFVPYWQLDGNAISFPEVDYTSQARKRMVYFGIAVDAEGIQTSELGYQKLSLFIEKAPAEIDTYLGVRMTDDAQNTALLASSDAQKKIIEAVVPLAANRGFEGIVVDLELKPTLNGSVPAQINTFVENFHSAAQAKNLKLAITMYGDTFYRKRPYDIEYLSKVVDEIMIMTYDFHKVSGVPGPNFPLRGKQMFGYDLETLAADVAGIPPEKLTFIYGMYGYDWVVDEKKRPFRPAKSVTLAQIKKNFIDQCAVINCVMTRDKNAAEREIDFIDKTTEYHVVWYEDMESSREKTEFLNSKGIGSVAFWAYGFF